MTREDAIADFLRQHQWQDATRQDFPADFSPRHYARLTKADGGRAILMMADADQKTAEFVAIAGLLRQMEISAPEIYAADVAQGLVVLEDFGDQNIGRLIDAGGDARLYGRQAAELLAHLHGVYQSAQNALQLPVFNCTLFTQQVSLFVDAYVPYALKRAATSGEKQDFINAWQQVLGFVDDLPQTLMLRDFMPDNLMLLPGRADWRAIGVLDFQDAGLGPMAYDLASLCEQTRREVNEATVQDIVVHYAVAAPLRLDAAAWLHACHIFAAQRHMRIMGLIAQLAARGRAEKRVYLPRIEKHVRALLGDTRLAPVQAWLNAMNMDK